MKSIAGLLTLLSALNISAQGLVTFNAATNFSGTNYAEAGVRFSSSSGAMSTWWGQGSNLPVNSTPYLVFNYYSGLSISLTNGQPFGLASVNLADPRILTGPSPEIVFKGFKADGSMVTNRFTTPGNRANTFGYFPFTSEFSYGLTNVEALGPFAMDNLKVLTGTTPPPLIQAPVVPEFKTISYPVGATIGALATGDFNRDGNADIVVSVPGWIRFFHGTGDGTFGSSVDSACATNALYTSLATGDFNDDSRLDLVASRQGGEVATLLSTPGGGYTVATQSLAGFYNGRLITAADFNNDRKPDIAIASDSGVLVAFATGLGRFVSETNYMFSSARAVAAEDFNEDGFMDFAVAGDYAFGVFANKGNGTFALSQSYSSSYSSSCLILGDFDKDGHSDLAAPMGHGLRVRLGNGQTLWMVKDYFVNYGFGTGGVAADFNGDGNLDLVICGHYGRYVFPGLGNGSFSVAKESNVGGGSTITADCNNDGLPDVVSASGSSFSVMLNITPPLLRLTPLPGYNQISWRSGFGDAYTVEYSVNPLDSRSWKPFPYPPVLIGTERAIADWTDAPQKFYRLSKPMRQ